MWMDSLYIIWEMLAIIQAYIVNHGKGLDCKHIFEYTQSVLLGDIKLKLDNIFTDIEVINSNEKRIFLSFLELFHLIQYHDGKIPK